ncbi:hypothetical protein ACQ4PT_015906 [Festuca glaucescens]
MASSSTSNLVRHPNYGPLPLFKCMSCRWRVMERYTASTSTNASDFVKCTNHNIDDCITEDYRQQKMNTPNVISKLKGQNCRNGKASTSNKKAANPRASPAMNLFMENMLKRMMDHIDKKMVGISDQCAQKVLKVLNYKGVGYKPVKGNMSDNGHNHAGDIASTHSYHKKLGKEFMERDDSESSDGVSCLGPVYDDPLDEPMYITPTKDNGLEGTEADMKGRTPENPIVIENNIHSPASSSERAEIAKDVAVTNATRTVKYPDVSKWPIKKFDMPKQRDGNSCGLFVLQRMEHWDGDEFTTKLSQKFVDDSRELTVA